MVTEHSHGGLYRRSNCVTIVNLVSVLEIFSFVAFHYSYLPQIGESIQSIKMNSRAVPVPGHQLLMHLVWSGIEAITMRESQVLLKPPTGISVATSERMVDQHGPPTVMPSGPSDEQERED